MGAVGTAAPRVRAERASADFAGFEGLSVLGRRERTGLRAHRRRGAGARSQVVCPEPGPLRFLVPVCDLGRSPPP